MAGRPFLLECPMARGLLGVMCVGALLLTACASKASDEQCSKACGNVATVAMGEVHRQLEEHEDLKNTGETGREMATAMAQTMMDGIRSECRKQCRDKGTRKQAECLEQSTTMDELESCR
jgi:hypothetical protein